jgi:hypothetical protein
LHRSCLKSKTPSLTGSGLSFVFGGAGLGGVLAGVLFTAVSPQKRERAMALGGLIGFALAAIYYILALLVQVG